MAWPQPTGLGVPAPRWGWQCCHFWGVLPGLWEGARFGGVSAFGGSFWTWGRQRLKVCPWAWGFFGGGVASEPGGWCQFAGKLQGLGTLLCRVHAARFGGCCQVWGASGFNVCSWIWAMLPSLRVISGLGGLKAAPAPVETSPAVPAAVPAVHFVRCWAPVWSCSTLWLVVSAARVAGWPPWRRAGVPPSDVFHLLCLR